MGKPKVNPDALIGYIIRNVYEKEGINLEYSKVQSTINACSEYFALVNIAAKHDELLKKRHEEREASLERYRLSINDSLDKMMASWKVSLDG